MALAERISREDSLYIDQLRGISITRVVLGHLGLFWLFPPYSQFLHALLPLLFFVSGAVSFFSYKRASTDAGFLAKRFSGLLTPYYLVIILSFSVLWFFSGKLPDFDARMVFDWLTINPSPETMPYSLGQVWFLRALAWITLISPLVFRAMHRSVFYALVPLALSLALAAARLAIPIHKCSFMYLFGHNLYAPLVNAGFFFLGALVYARKDLFAWPRVLAIVLAALMVSVGLVLSLDLSINLADNAYRPNLYYVTTSFAAVMLIYLAWPALSLFFVKVKIFNGCLLFVSHHSYSIFLLHSFFIFASEKWLGLVSVKSDPKMAAAKILFVLAATAVTAIPLTRVSWFCRRNLEGLLGRLRAAYCGVVLSRG